MALSVVPSGSTPLSAPQGVQPSARWHLGLLGGLRLHDGTSLHTRLATRAITALLARLALWPQRDHAREELIELLWPGIDLPTGRRRLRQALSLLKAVLEPPESGSTPVLQADRLSVRVVSGAIECDVHHFETLVKRGQREAALALYRGDLLPGFFDEWILEERARLLAVHDKALAAPAAAPVQHTKPALVYPAPAAPRKEPADASPAAHADWPHYLTRFFDDSGQSDRLLAQVQQHRLVTLLGPGGSGKTRLAVQLVEQVAQAGRPSPLAKSPPAFSILCFVPLAAAQTRDQLLSALQAALHIVGAGPTLDALLTRLEGVKALLVLDNAEQLAGVADDVISGLTTALPGLHLLVTSRCPLGMDGEREFPIAALGVPGTDAPLQVTAQSPAVALFVDRARAVRLDFHLSDRNHSAIAELVRVLEGMPLAIELAASRVRGFSPAQMLDRLRAPALGASSTPGLDLLTRQGPRSTLPSRHASMQRTIDWSWQQLSADQQALAGAMAAFPGGCDAQMLGAVHQAADIAAGLEHLHAHSLVRAQTVDPAVNKAADSAPRFQLYEPIREYAAAQFEPALGLAWRGRQRAWVQAWLQAMPATPPLLQVRAEHTNLEVAFTSAAVDGAGDDAVGLVLAMRPLHEAVTLPGETLSQACAAVGCCTDGQRRSRARSALALWTFTAGGTQAAKQLADTALADAPAPSAARGWALQALASVCWRGTLSSAGQVLEWVDEAQQLAQTSGDRDLLAALLSQRAYAQHGLDGDAQAARALHAQAQALWEALGNRHAINYARYNVAVFDFHSGQRESALRQWDEIAAEATLLQDWRRLSVVNSARCAALSEMHRWPEAQLALRESLRQSWRALRLYDIAVDLWNLPRVLAHLRRPREALTLMSFAAQFWQSRFGELTLEDKRHVQRVQRLAARQIDAPQRAQAAAQGRQLTLAEAVELALALAD